VQPFVSSQHFMEPEGSLPSSHDYSLCVALCRMCVLLRTSPSFISAAKLNVLSGSMHLLIFLSLFRLNLKAVQILTDLQLEHENYMRRS
jgi:hypothetical protein